MKTASKILCSTASDTERFIFLILPVFIALAAFATSPLAQGATQTSITLTWTAPGDDANIGTATAYDIRYSLSSINASNWSSATQVTGEPSPQIAGSAESFTITGLTPGTLYYFAMKAVDEADNWSSLSNVISRSTLNETTPPSAIATLVVNGTAQTSVTLNWTAPGDDGATGTASQYDVRYATSTITDLNWNSATQATGEPSPHIAGTGESFTVTGLNSSTTYYFAVKTADDVPNWSGLSNVVSGTTGAETTAPTAIANVSISGATATSVTLAWTATGDDGTTGTAAQYDVRYAAAPITLANWNSATQATGEPTPKVSGSAESFTISSLSSGTTYYFAIRVADEVPNWSGLSNVVNTSTTDVTPPSAIIDLAAATGEEHGELDISWTAPGDDGQSGRASYYVIAFSEDSITESNWEQADLWVSPPVPQQAGQHESITLTGLTPAKTYYVAIKSVDDGFNLSDLSNCPSAEAYFDLGLDVDDDALAGLPTEFRISQNYPNPFNPTTIINYSVPAYAHVTIHVYNILGQLTATLVDESQAPGQYAAEWNGIDSNGQPAASGVYMYRMIADNYSETKKMLLLQ